VLSRSSGRESIRLLCDFDDKLFMASHNLALVDENERLENLNIETKLWYERMVEIDAIRAHSCIYKSQIHSSHILKDRHDR
jgi:hypothetical protein